MWTRGGYGPPGDSPERLLPDGTGFPRAQQDRTRGSGRRAHALAGFRDRHVRVRSTRPGYPGTPAVRGAAPNRFSVLGAAPWPG